MTDQILPRMILSAWWQEISTRTVVFALAIMAALDSVYTSVWIDQHGLGGEVNPLIRSLFEMGLGSIWLIGNVAVTFLGAVFLGSCIVLLSGRPRVYPILGMSLLAALKVVLGLYHLIQFYGIIEFGWVLWITAVVAFLATREFLREGRIVDWSSTVRSIREMRNDFSTFMVFSRAPKTKPSVHAEAAPIRLHPARTGDRAKVWRNWRLFFWMGVIVLAPILAFSLVELVLRTSGVLDLPSWMRRLGIVSEQQGRVFLFALITAVLTVAALIYAIVAVFEILSSEPTRRRGSPQRVGKFMKRAAICSLIVMLFLASAPRTYAAQQALVSTVSLSDDPAEIVAVADSKGRIHAAWIENGNELAGSGEADVWYSVYNPESTTARTAHFVGKCSRVYSLDLTIDASDKVRILWVGESAAASGSVGQPTTGGEQALKEVWYQEIDSGETLSAPPSMLVAFPADFAVASVVSWNESQSYVAWAESVRDDTSQVSSTLYYGALIEDDGSMDLTRVPVVSTSGMSRILKVVATPDQDSLNLAWVQDSLTGSSRIMYSRLVLSGNVIETRVLANVSGTVDGLTLVVASNGDVVVGWVDGDSVQGRSTIYVARMSRVKNATLSELETPSRRLADIESMTVDYQGNLHLLWVDRGDDLVGPRLAHSSARGLHYARFSSTTSPSTEKEEDYFYLSMIAAVVLDNGRVYVVSREGTLEAAKPVPPNNPVPLLALLVLSSALAGLDTEAGTYLFVRWKRALARSSQARRRTSSVDMKLVQRLARRPGLTLSDLRSVGRSTVFDVAERLLNLETSGILRSVREGSRRRFYCFSAEHCVKSRSVELRDSILRLVEDEPGINEAAIAKRLALSQQLANYHLRLLTEARALSGIRTEGRVTYYVNEWCRRSAPQRDPRDSTRLRHSGIQYSRNVS